MTSADGESLLTSRAASSERVHMRDGTIVELRHATDTDEGELRAFLGELCLEARHLRFFTAAVDLDDAARWAAATATDRFGLLAHDQTGLLVGHGTSIQIDDERAEVAVEVADALHGEGLGTILLERLAAIAEARGISQFVAEVLPENRAMLDVFREGFGAHVRLQDHTNTVEFPTATWRFARERFDTVRGSTRASTPPLSPR